MNEKPLPAGVARALRRLREGAVIRCGGFSAWLDNPMNGFQQRLHLHTFDALCARGLLEQHPTLTNGWRLRKDSC
jgi:hypothetical protein